MVIDWLVVNLIQTHARVQVDQWYPYHQHKFTTMDDWVHCQESVIVPNIAVQVLRQGKPCGHLFVYPQEFPSQVHWRLHWISNGWGQFSTVAANFGIVLEEQSSYTPLTCVNVVKASIQGTEMSVCQSTLNEFHVR